MTVSCTRHFGLRSSLDCQIGGLDSSARILQADGEDTDSSDREIEAEVPGPVVKHFVCTRRAVACLITASAAELLSIARSMGWRGPDRNTCTF